MMSNSMALKRAGRGLALVVAASFCGEESVYAQTQSAPTTTQDKNVVRDRLRDMLSVRRSERENATMNVTKPVDMSLPRVVAPPRDAKELKWLLDIGNSAVDADKNDWATVCLVLNNIAWDPPNAEIEKFVIRVLKEMRIPRSKDCRITGTDAIGLMASILSRQDTSISNDALFQLATGNKSARNRKIFTAEAGDEPLTEAETQYFCRAVCECILDFAPPRAVAPLVTRICIAYDPRSEFFRSGLSHYYKWAKRIERGDLSSWRGVP